MSNTTTNATFSVGTQIGGIPTDSDVVPSVIFIIGFAALGGFLVLRSFLGGRFSPYIYTIVFCITRIVAFVSRIIWVKTTPTASNANTLKTIATVEVATLGLGLFLLFEFSFACIRFLKNRNKRSAALMPSGVRWLIEFLPRIASIMLVISATSVGSAKTQKDIDFANTLKNAGLFVNAAACVAVYALCLIYANVSELRQEVRGVVTKLGFVALINTFIFVETIYRLIQREATSPDDEINNKTIFYLAMPGVEIVAVFLISVIPAKRWYVGPVDVKAQARDDAEIYAQAAGYSYQQNSGSYPHFGAQQPGYGQGGYQYSRSNPSKNGYAQTAAASVVALN